MELSRRLKKLRSIKGLTQAKMAQNIGVATSTYQNYERGEREASESFLKKVVTSFGVSTDWLLMGQGSMFTLSHEDASEILGGDLHNIAESIDVLETKFSPEERDTLYTFMDSLPPALKEKLLSVITDASGNRSLSDIKKELREMKAEIDEIKKEQEKQGVATGRLS